MIARQKFPNIPICAGNVCTSEGYADLLSTGVDMVKVGVGPSPRCTTRLMTGVGVPQASALLDIKTYCDLNGLDYKYICDGGIYNGREISLAMALGSIAVMVGTRYSKVRENNTRYFDPLTEKWWGVSSGSAHFKTSSEIRGLTYNEYFPFSEGARSVVELNEDFISITHELISGLRSAMSYSNSKTIKEFHTNSKLGIQTNSGYVEGVSTVIK
jgi:IMP dehydrogenase